MQFPSDYSYKNRNDIMLELAKNRIAEKGAMPKNVCPSETEIIENCETVYSYTVTSAEIMNVNDMTENVEYDVQVSEPLIDVQTCGDGNMEIETAVNEAVFVEPVDNIYEHNIIMIDNTANNIIQSDNEAGPTDSVKRNSKSKYYDYEKNVSQQNRMKGSAYQGYERDRTKQINYGIERPGRKLGETCSSNYCLKSKLRKCSQFTTTAREKIFAEFWKMDWAQKKMYVCNLIKEVSKKRLYTEGSSRRTKSLSYFLKTRNGEMLQVCQKMFLNTIGIKEKMMRLWLKNGLPHGLQINPTETSKSRKVRLTATDRFIKNDRRQSHLKLFLETYPKLESHYCRKDTKKIYLQTLSDSKTALYNNEYVIECKKNQVEPLSNCVFNNFLKESNYSIFKPRKDQCDTCTEYKVGNLEVNQYNHHRALVDRARAEMDTDLKLATDGHIIMFCMDVQAVKLCPQLDASLQYYKMKLQIHNFTIYNVVTHDSYNYIWDETQGQLLASCFTTIICNHIKFANETNESKVPIIIYSDGCGYQNRNEVLSNALCNLSTLLKIVIEQKYLEKGHTQNACDSTHSLIERKIKGKLINLPSEFASLAKEARRKPRPLEIHLLNFDYFFNYDSPELKKYKSIRPGKLVGDPTVNQLKCLKYTPEEEIRYKIHFDHEYKPLPQRSTSLKTQSEPKRMYWERLTISESKFKHLQDLKLLIPSDTHGFYDNIPYHADKPKSKK